MTLLDLNTQLRRAKCRADVFLKNGDDATKYRELAAICHPDKNPDTPDLAKDTFVLLEKWHKFEEWKIGGYTVVGDLGRGDLSNIYVTATDLLLKVAPAKLGKKLLSREVGVVNGLRYKPGSAWNMYLPHPFEVKTEGDKTIAAYEFGGRDKELCSVLDVMRTYPNGVPSVHIAWMFNRLLEVLGYVHSEGVVNGAILPTHVMFHPQSHGCVLLGWLHSVKVGEKLQLISEAYRTTYPQEVVNKQPVVPATDIYMAARLMDALSERDLPRPMRVCLKGCMLERASMRPQCAWSLHDDWGNILKKVFGPRKFHTFEV